MKSITKIYKDYNIPPPLQEHMLRVAGVASILCDNSSEDIDKDSVVKACLLHDMGNIIKFNLEKSPEGAHLDDIDHWKQVQEDFIKRYGDDQHSATEQIANEIGISEAVMNIIKSIGFSKACINVEINDYAIKMAAYADTRVAPSGVFSLEERLEDGYERYKDVYNSRNDLEFRDKQHTCLKNLEAQVFEKQSIEPEYITDAVVNERIEELKEVKI